jgi:hypothetical protein
MDFSRVRPGEIAAGIGGIALFIFLFLDWYGGNGDGFSGWESLGGDFSGLLVFLAAIAGVKLAGLAALGMKLNIPVPRGGVTAALGYLAATVIILRIFAAPDLVDLEFGLFLGLAAALVIAVGAMLALRERGFEPVVAVADVPRSGSAASSDREREPG